MPLRHIATTPGYAKFLRAMRVVSEWKYRQHHFKQVRPYRSLYAKAMLKKRRALALARQRAARFNRLPNFVRHRVSVGGARGARYNRLMGR